MADRYLHTACARRLARLASTLRIDGPIVLPTQVIEVAVELKLTSESRDLRVALVITHEPPLKPLITTVLVCFTTGVGSGVGTGVVVGAGVGSGAELLLGAIGEVAEPVTVPVW